MAMTPQIQNAIRGFNDIILGGVPFLLRQSETAFLSFMCAVAAIDALAGYRYTTDKDMYGKRFELFIENYFPTSYASHAKNLCKLRCHLLHNFSPAYFTVVHESPADHLQPSSIGDTILSDKVFFADLKAAAMKFFDEVQKDVPNRQDTMNARLLNLDKGGAIYYEQPG
jgi:hypothetical protein